MKKITFLITLLLLPFFGKSQDSQKNIIIKLKNSDTTTYVKEDNYIGIKEVDSINKYFKAISVKRLYTGKNSESQLFVIKYPNSTAIEKALPALQNIEALEYAQPDHKVYPGGHKVNMTPNDAEFYKQWALYNDGSFIMASSTAGADIDMKAAWDIEQGDENIIVAVIDTGNAVQHIDFQGRIWTNINEIPNNGIDDDGNGFIDDVYGWNFSEDNNNIADNYGHGTNVASIIGAKGNNGIGFTGVDLNCKLMSLKVFENQNGGTFSPIVEAIYYAVDNGAKVINLSLGGLELDIPLVGAVQYALSNNVVVVAAMMNDNEITPNYPANLEGVIAVGATTPKDRRSTGIGWGSNYGSHISVVAPGSYIYGLSNDNFAETYDSFLSGTSQATPHVSGLASLLLAQDPTRTPAQIKTIIENSAEDQVGRPEEDTPGFDIYYGHGRINAFNALTYTLDNPEFTIKDNSLMVYPNPSNGNINVTTNLYPAVAKIYNILGQLVVQQQLNSNNNTINIPYTGTFILSVKNNNNISIKKIIVQ